MELYIICTLAPEVKMKKIEFIEFAEEKKEPELDGVVAVDFNNRADHFHSK